MNREQLAEAPAVAAENGSIGATDAMALAARLLNGRSSQAGAGENRCWDYISPGCTTGRWAGCAFQLPAAADAQSCFARSEDIDVRQLRTAAEC